MVYGVFGGEYSGWRVEGYFTKRKDADKYCAIKDGLYVIDLSKINADVSKVVLKYYHVVVFDSKTGMKDQPTNYECFTGKDRRLRADYDRYGWLAIHTVAKTRKKAEKIAQDIYTRFLSYYSETGDYEKAFKMLKLWEEE